MKICFGFVASVLLLIASSAGATGEVAGPSQKASETSDAPRGGSNAVIHSDSVARAILTSEVVDREPVDDLESLTSERTQIYFFTELVGLEGTRVTHRWEYKGESVDEVHLSIGGPRWRIWSSKKLDPTWLGHWAVSLVSEDGEVLATDTFIYAEK
jgi:hypothetical protein